MERSKLIKFIPRRSLLTLPLTTIVYIYIPLSTNMFEHPVHIPPFFTTSSTLPKEHYITFMESSSETTVTTTTTTNSSRSSSSPPRPATPPPVTTVVSPCAACKILRRRCAEKCVLAPYFPPNDPLKFTTAHRVFGASNIIKLLQV